MHLDLHAKLCHSFSSFLPLIAPFPLPRPQTTLHLETLLQRDLDGTKSILPMFSSSLSNHSFTGSVSLPTAHCKLASRLHHPSHSPVLSQISWDTTSPLLHSPSTDHTTSSQPQSAKNYPTYKMPFIKFSTSIKNTSL